MDICAYLHFPWCLQKCPYCDFASGAIRRAQVPHAAYADAIIAELSARAPALRGRRLGAVFFGGGTPSLWAPSEIGRVLSALRAAFDAEAPGLEVTVECNPSSLDRARAAALREAGVTRLSIGVQSLDADRLRYLGRLHSPEGALDALRGALQEMPRVSGDLMFGMPGQTPADFLHEAQQLLDLGLSHLSIYALTIEPDTQFGQLHRKGRLKVSPSAVFADTFEATRALMAEHGLQHYEVSNYARPGEASRHNQHYWRGGAYLGLGAGAVGLLPGVDGREGANGVHGRPRRYRNSPVPAEYQAAPGGSEVFEETLAAVDQLNEALMLGLRTAEGVDCDAVAARCGLDPRVERAAAIARQRDLGNLRVESADGQLLRVPPERWLHLDSIVTDLF